MENFIVSARKYRPATFETVVGQNHITGTLKNAIRNNQLAQAFLFCGPRGVGKTTCARILAKTINCTNLTAEVEACGTCESCVSFQTGHSFNFHELDAASNNSVDDIRSLIEQVRIPPQAGKYKIYIIDEVHMLSANAFNAFLKTLEEPPSYAIFILATTEKHKILPTILSRCQIFDFNRIQVDDISGLLNKIAIRENISVEADGLHIIAQKADGGLRDALSMFDQIVSYTNKNLTYKSVIDNLNILDYDYYFRLTQYLTSSDVSQTLVLFDEILNNGFDGNNFINGLASHLRNLLVAKDPQTVKLLEVSENIKQKYLTQSQQTQVSFILTALNLANQCDLTYKNSKNQRLQVELALIKMCHITSVLQLAQLPHTASTTATDLDQTKKKTSVIAESPAPQDTPDELPPPASGFSASAEMVSKPASAIPSIAALPKTIPIPDKSPSTDAIRIPAMPNLNTIHKIALKPNISGSPAAGTMIPSLTAMTNADGEIESDEPKYVFGEEREPFSFEELMVLWNEYTQKVKLENKINFYTILTTNEPVLTKPTEITVLITNTAQDSILQNELVDFLNFLRTRLKNFDVGIVTKKVESKIENRLYTSIERYQYLVEKNPKLEDLRKRFNLDLLP
ncbi:DNA polymerase III subunit gamma/tau [Pedobacter hartonius]|uniref:DNA polymerase III subunit gamma/tau n=1 Tax=Pedobacter hartonius TaxID=425514 RepID=A0A1H3YHG2_9SPHI|nr:DNA polymerase III subunit gamma/tau [Pedobacter hartonius]SEA11030.1 DNA polymerase-3 subunit gamma/tau [Pedobacter hartonius]